MNKKKKALLSPAATMIVFFIALGLLAYAGVGTSRAALTYFSNDYATRMRMDNIGVSLVENGNIVSHRDYISQRTTDANGEEALTGYWDSEVPGRLLQNMLTNEEGETEPLVLKRDYKEELSVRNTGRSNVSISGEDNSAAINEYVRVTIRKYWLKTEEKPHYWYKTSENQRIAKRVLENGETIGKQTGLSPKLINLKYNGQSLDDENLISFNGWIKDKTVSTDTDERIVLYYSSLLNAGEETAVFANSISIDDMVVKSVTKTTVGNTTTTTYDYDGLTFCLEVSVDAVQEHNAVDAVHSAWGENVTINSDGSLSLRRTE